MSFLKKYLFLSILLIGFLCFGQIPNVDRCDEVIEEGIELMFSKKHVQSLELLVEAASVAKENTWHKQEFRALLNIGSNYYLMSDFGEALEYYLKAYEIAISNLETKDELTVLNNIGILYFQEKDYLKAKTYFKKAYDLSFESDNKSKHGYYAINLALVSNKMGLGEEASSYIEEAIPLVKEQSEILLMTKLAKAENLFIKGNYNKSIELSLELLNDLKGDSNYDKRTFILLLLSQVNEKEKRFLAALEYAQKARNASKVLENREDVYNAMANIYASLQEYDKALLYKDSVLIARDTLQKIRNSNLYENNKIKFELQSYEHQLSESKILLQKERRFYNIIVGCGVLLLALLIWIFLNYSTRFKQRKKISELELEQEKSKRLVAEKQIREQEVIVQLEQERLKNELDVKNRKLTSKALYLSSRNELIEEIIAELSANPQLKSHPELLIHIKALSTHLKKEPQLESFFTHFEEVNPGFSNRLLKLNPNLTQQDIRFIIYLYMNLDNTEIASLLNITPQSCRKRKERIGKKLNIPNDASLTAYIASI